MPCDALHVVRQTFALFNEHGGRHYGENVTELEHALQCATLAIRNNEAPAVVAACLLHDYGHLVHELGEDIAEKGVDARHEELGADRLESQFIPEVVEPIRLHVAAKRFLCWKDPAYLAGLSAASTRSLELQGGPMTDSEARAFADHPHFANALRVRHYDDLGKVEGMPTAYLEEFTALLALFVRQGD